MKEILLALVSSKEQEEGQSIPAQERRLKEYAERKGLEADKVFTVTESSTKSIQTCEPFTTLVDYKKSPKGWGRLDSNQRRPKSRDLQSEAIQSHTIIKIPIILVISMLCCFKRWRFLS